jgi:thiol:disulfide interchange protein DsbD
MRKVLLIQIFLFFLALNLSPLVAQDTSNQVKWTVVTSPKNDKAFVLNFKGVLPKGWHLYAKDEEDAIDGFEVAYKNTAFSQQPIKIKTPFKSFKDDFFEGKIKQVVEDSVEFEQVISFESTPPAFVRATLKYIIAFQDNFIPEEQEIKIQLNETAPIGQSRLLINTIDINKPLVDCNIGASSKSNTQSKSLLQIFILGLLGGLVALLTPCVFPMIPLTVSYFTKKSISKKSGIKNALLYGFFIFFIYILLSLPFHFLNSINPDFLNNISTNVYLNVIFFVVFILFALSFFGLYEITLPAKFSTGADSKSGIGNVLGIFFMALTLALVSFSCTGPILGSLLVGSLASNGGAMQLTMGMAGFGFALALPFALFALFPNWLQSLPKSGGWLNTVKITLGFLELAFALKFLSNADMVKHWGILKREIFIGIWILIGAAMTLYLFGILKIEKHSVANKISKGRKILACCVGLFTLYLIPGVTNTSWANLKLISGFPPPVNYSLYHGSSECILNFSCTKNYDEAIKMAKAEKKPILIDFTGYACVNCRRMEETVWTDSQVSEIIRNNFIVVSLYVDDKKLLPSNEQFTYKMKDGTEKEIVMVGDKWATLETENFANSAQPYYAIISPDEMLLNKPIDYTDKKTYLEWLTCGLNAFKNK